MNRPSGASRCRLRPAAAAGLAVLIALACPPGAMGFTPTLSPADVEQAVDAGRSDAAARNHGLMVRDYVLYDAADPLSVSPGEGEVEAVIVGTPFERLHYRSYLQSFQGNVMTAADAAKYAASLANTLHVVIFAHSPGPDPKYQDFLRGFSDVALTLPSGQTLKPVNSEVFGPARDFYNVVGKTGAGAREFLWLGSNTFRFNLAELKLDEAALAKLAGTLSFTDSSGKAYSFPVDLAKYR